MSTLAPGDRFEFAPPPTQGLGRSLVLAVLAHAVLLAALTWGVNWKSNTLPVTAEAELWSALPQAAAPRLIEVPPEPAPEPRPAPTPVIKAPAPPPPPPKAEVLPTLPDPAIALAQEKRRLQKEKQQALDKLEKEKIAKARQQQDKLKQEKLAQEKARREADQLQAKRQQDKEKEAKKARDKKALDDKKLAESKKKAEQAAERNKAAQAAAQAQKIEAQRQANLKRIAGLAGATGADNATGTALRASGPSPGYAGRIRASIRPNIILLDDIAGNPVAEVEVRTSPDGTIVSRKLLKSSGEKSWDDAVLKAIDKTATLPKDVDGRVPPVLVISFRPKD